MNQKIEKFVDSILKNLQLKVVKTSIRNVNEISTHKSWSYCDIDPDGPDYDYEITVDIEKARQEIIDLIKNDILLSYLFKEDEDETKK